MGQSTDAYLAFGIDLGDNDEIEWPEAVMGDDGGEYPDLALTPAAPAADELPAFEPLMLRGLTFAQALASMRATGCAIRRNHWCAPIVRLVASRPHLDDEGEVESAPYHPATDDRRAADWEMIPSPELEPDQPVKGETHHGD